MIEVLCFVDDFKAWLEKEQLGTYPIDSAQGDFGSLVAAWLQSEDGKDLTKEWPQHFGFVAPSPAIHCCGLRPSMVPVAFVVYSSRHLSLSLFSDFLFSLPYHRIIRCSQAEGQD